jgi:asparagine synthase (glutamine-hydrolysing)
MQGRMIMCGILAIIGQHCTEEEARQQVSLMQHRGPDQWDVQSLKHGVLAHQRLSINDLDTGKQPIAARKGAWLIHNGEIYNHKKLRNQFADTFQFQTYSDSEVILPLYYEMGSMLVHQLDGVFAFVLIDGEKVLAARDAIGVKPLYYGSDQHGQLWFASEVKALIDKVEEVQEFPPGYYFTREEGFVQWFKPDWLSENVPSGLPFELRSSFVDAVKKRLMSDVPLGVLLSGGLDSSLVASIVAREMKSKGKIVSSFSVGLAGESPDLIKAKKVAEFIGTDHHEIVFTPEQGIELLKELIYKLESYDVTTIRASTPMYIMSKYIREQGVKVVLSGEGADEIFGGYLYFKNAPSKEEFHHECVRRIKRLNSADVLRADRSTMGAGIEARVPFLDLDFLKVAMELDPSYKVMDGGRIEKHVLRQAFVDLFEPYLPDDVLWRQKEQFSDGVGYSWVDELKIHTEAQITDKEFSQAVELYPFNTPDTKEAFFYRRIYEGFYHKASASKLVKKWIPRWQDDKDPSGRASTYHEQTYYEEAPEDLHHQVEEQAIFNS